MRRPEIRHGYTNRKEASIVADQWEDESWREEMVPNYGNTPIKGKDLKGSFNTSKNSKCKQDQASFVKKTWDRVVGDLMAKTQRKRRFADAKIERYRILLLRRKRMLMVSTW